MMKLAILGLFLVLSWANQDWYKDRGALVLTKETIGPIMMKPHQIKIITFLTPECLECQGMTIVLDIYSKGIHKKGRQDINIYEVNCMDEKELCQEMGVTRLPFIFIFNPEGMAEEEYPGDIYNHEETLNLIMAAIKKIDEGQFLKKEQSSSSHMRVQQKPSQLREDSKSENPELTQQSGQNGGQTNSLKQGKQNPNTLERSMEQKDNSKTPENPSTQRVNTIVPSSKDTLAEQLNRNQIHQQFLNNIKRSRKHKQSFLSLASSSFLISMGLAVIGVGIGIYLKNILSHSAAIKKVIVGNKVYSNYQQDDETERLAMSRSEKEINY